MRRRARIVLIAVAALALAAPAAHAIWSAVLSSGSNGQARATSVGAGQTPSAAITTGTNVQVSWATSVLGTGQNVTQYLVKRYPSAGGAAAVIGSNCSGTVTGLTCTEATVPDGSWAYKVTPRFATNWSGDESAQSNTVVIDTTAPNVAIAHPASGGNYTAAQWASGCAPLSPDTTPDDFCGTASDATSGLQKVEVSIKRNSDNKYWNGSAFSANTEELKLATGTATWRYPLPSASLAAGTYTIAAKATDNTNLTTTTTHTFTFVAAAGCTEPQRTVAPNLDTYIDQDAQTANNSASQDLFVTTEGTKNRRTLIRFNIGALPAGCQVTSATLNMPHNDASTGRTIQAHRITATWVDTVGWSTQPGTGGTAATATTGAVDTATLSFTTNVGALVQSMFTSGNFGFMLRDSAEGNASKIEQKFNGIGHAPPAPNLVINFGPV